MLWYIFKQLFSIILLVMLLLLYFKIDNRKIFMCTSFMLVVFIPLRRLFRHIDYNNFIDGYPILEIADFVIPVLVLIMTVVVANKYKKYKSLNNDESQ